MIAVRSHRMDASDRHNGRRDERTNGQTDGRRDASVCAWDGVWH